MFFYKLIVDPKILFCGVCAGFILCSHYNCKNQVCDLFIRTDLEACKYLIIYQLFDRFIGRAIGIAVSIKDWCGQVTKSVWGMSRCREAMKDVVGCDKPGAGV